MPDTQRNELARVLADIDQLLAEAESIAQGRHAQHLRQTALDFLIEFQDMKRDVEAEMRSE